MTTGFTNNNPHANNNIGDVSSSTKNNFYENSFYSASTNTSFVDSSKNNRLVQQPYGCQSFPFSPFENSQQVSDSSSRTNSIPNNINWSSGQSVLGSVLNNNDNIAPSNGSMMFRNTSSPILDTYLQNNISPSGPTSLSSASLMNTSVSQGDTNLMSSPTIASYYSSLNNSGNSTIVTSPSLNSPVQQQQQQQQQQSGYFSPIPVTASSSSSSLSNNQKAISNPFYSFNAQQQINPHDVPQFDRASSYISDSLIMHKSQSSDFSLSSANYFPVSNDNGATSNFSAASSDMNFNNNGDMHNNNTGSNGQFVNGNIHHRNKYLNPISNNNGYGGVMSRGSISSNGSTNSNDFATFPVNDMRSNHISSTNLATTFNNNSGCNGRPPTAIGSNNAPVNNFMYQSTGNNNHNPVDNASTNYSAMNGLLGVVNSAATSSSAAAAVNGGTQVLENGLLLSNGKISSSSELQDLYKNCGSNYFASDLAFKFVDQVKNMIYFNVSPHAERIQVFVNFLKSCNLNYNPQSDAFLSTTQKETASSHAKSKSTNPGIQGKNGGNNSSGRNAASSCLHYRPLVLVVLKNGKLELLSVPKTTNLQLHRSDLVIIDGDRGKDLALVVEPEVDLDLALFINFLKKKIHFDSLITKKDQHFPNSKFVDTLVKSSNKGQTDVSKKTSEAVDTLPHSTAGEEIEELNPRLYDVIELTQLIIPSKQVLRFATPIEVSTNLHNKFQDELKALHIAQLKLKSLNSGHHHHHHHQNHHANEGTNIQLNNKDESKEEKNLNIKILNAEFQFDRKKLTFYYICEERNDFRELIKELFKFYKTRIWLCALPNNLEIDSKYYDNQHFELAMYNEMMTHNDLQRGTSMNDFVVVAPSLDKIKLDDFQIGVYKELVEKLFM
ncbi:uncharacterized protein SCODWIG_00704 [Saccharomycodes ludwigii]|uniref:PSP1 C-terminal domain-containing protein n=1 Tax=Saccharomycodes ludwigii TaxID=36035 RepID=A0A376B2P0_9ASCO|nr:uncharacterized protein SCODWIG_00704 [Saccharomycodes ludwigii]